MIRNQIALTPIETTANGVATIGGFNGLFANVVSAAIGLSGIAFFIMLIMGGFKYLTSGGDPKAVQGAQGTLTWAVFGLVGVALAYLFLRLIANFTGVQDILNFQVVR